jgi:hypothetical protein
LTRALLERGNRQQNWEDLRREDPALKRRATVMPTDANASKAVAQSKLNQCHQIHDWDLLIRLPVIHVFFSFNRVDETSGTELKNLSR